MGRQQSGRMGEDIERRMDGFNNGFLKSARKTGAQNFCHQTSKTNKEGCSTGTQLNMAHRAKLWLRTGKRRHSLILIQMSH